MNEPAISPTRDVVPFREATRAWFGISLRTFGGPAGQISVMHRELVDDRRWIGEQRFLHALSYCTLLPGPEAQQLAIYIGWLLNGTSGGLVAGILFVLPGYIALMALSAIYAQWGATTAVTAIFAGLAPAVLAIVSQAVWRIGNRALKNRLLIAIAIGAFVALFVFNLAFPIVIAAAGVIGYLGARARPDLFIAKPSKTTGDTPPPLITDDALHGEPPSWPRAARILALGVTLWVAPVIVAAVTLGRSHVFVEQSVFFSGAAVVTFGGAYAVLSYVAQRAVEVYHWLLPGEMVNGLALAETTPGPLIMVVQFVGFLGAYRDPGDLNPWIAGVIGATLVHNTRLSASLTGITAAVVGVIANLSIFFAIHTLFNETRTHDWGPLDITGPVWSTLSLRAVFVAALAFVLAFRYRLSVLRVLGICAGVGVAIYLVDH